MKHSAWLHEGDFFQNWVDTVRERKDTDSTWSIQFIAAPTWSNLRQSVCAAIYYCHDRFEDVSVKYIQACRFHQSALESVFAVIRATAGTSNSKHSADALATMAMGRSVKTLSRGHMYDVMEDDDASTRINVFLTKTEKENQQKRHGNCNG